MNIQVVCFDIDGTLYPKWVTSWKLLRSCFPSISLAIRYQQFREYVRSAEHEQTVPANEQGFRERQARWLCSAAGEQDVQKMTLRIQHQFYDRWSKDFSRLRPFPHIREAFEQLIDQKVVIAALSDFPIDGKLEALGVADLVSYAACTEQSGYLKPHPAPFLMVCSELQVQPEAVLYVGDSCRKDIIGASQVGMRTALMDPTATSEKRREQRRASCANFDVIFSDYQEFVGYLPEMLR